MSEHERNPDPHARHRAEADEPTAPALDYGAFRCLADWSAGMVEEHLAFHYDADGTLTVAAAAGEAAADAGARQVRVPAFTTDPTRRVHSLLLSAEAGTVDLAPRTDAVFWSEAAVEKFVLPYYASLGAGRAAVVLAQLMGVWAEPVRDAHVIALTHYAHPAEPGATTVLDTLGVVFIPREADVPHCTTLRKFLQRYRPKLLGEHLAVRNAAPRSPRELPLPLAGAGMAAGFAPSYLELRVMAEWSSSLRGRPHWFVYDTGLVTDAEDPYKRFYPMDDAPRHEPASTLVIPTYTEPLLRDRPRVREVQITPHVRGAQPATLSGGGLTEWSSADAVFWSTGAVEHLLMPYYAQVYGGQALREIRQLYEAWWHNRPPRRGPDAVETQDFVAGEEGVEVYAMVHMPNSNWIPEDDGEGHSVSDVTYLVFAGPEEPGKTQVTSLREFHRRHPDLLRHRR